MADLIFWNVAALQMITSDDLILIKLIELCATENWLSKLDIFIKWYVLNVIVYLITKEQWVKPLVTQFMVPYMHHQAQQSILADLVQVPWVQAWQA